jgi:hypothetical protein
MAVRVLEVTRVAAPECLLRRLDDVCPREPRLIHDGIDLRWAFHNMAQAQFGRAARAAGQASVVRQVHPRPDSELEAGLEVEECDSSMLELGADDPLGRKPKAVAVEHERPLQIIDAQGDQCDAGLHFALGSLVEGYGAPLPDCILDLRDPIGLRQEGRQVGCRAPSLATSTEWSSRELVIFTTMRMRKSRRVEKKFHTAPEALVARTEGGAFAAGRSRSL